MSQSAILEMNGVELIGSLPSNRILKVFLAGIEHCFFIHNTPKSQVTLDDIVRDGYYQDFR